jgi:translation initiation factor 4E
VKVKREDNINKMWETLLMAMLGEQFEEPKVIGVSLSLRAKERLLEIWLKEGKSTKLKQNVSNKLRFFLNLNAETTTLYYKDHS